MDFTLISPRHETTRIPRLQRIHCWILNTFWKGSRRELEEKDLFNTLQEDQSEVVGDALEKNWRLELERANRQDRNPSLTRAIVKTFWGWYAFYSVLIGFQTLVVDVSQPIFLSWLLLYFKPDSTMPIGEAYGYAGGIFAASLVSAMCANHYSLGMYYIGMRIRVACCSLIYRKLLRLDRTSLGNTAAGQMVNLMTNDVARFDQVTWFFNYLWIAPAQVVIIAYFLWSFVGVSSFVGIGCIVLQLLPLHAVLVTMTSRLRMRVAVRTDKRVQLMSEIIAGIQVIKMYAWEKPFALLVELARRQEINVITKVAYLESLHTSFIIFTDRVALFATLLFYVLSGNDITADKVFALTSLFGFLSRTMAMFLPRCILFTAQTHVTIKRIQTFLLQSEIPSQVIDENPTEQDGGVILKSACAKWTKDNAQDTLRNIELRVEPGRMCAIVGLVGEGKSSLLQAILGELPLSSGSLHVGGRISYASQEPWLFSGSIRNNIMFGQTFEAERYNEVVRVCSLVVDFNQLPHGDGTLVGERGVVLSGGQRARINLARCLYRDADIYLLDDPLSAVDAHVSRHLFHECFQGFLRGKTVVLVTHQLHLLKQVGHVVVLHKGEILDQGTYAEVVSKSPDIVHRLREEEPIDPETSRKKDSLRKSTNKSLESSATGAAKVGPKEEEESRTRGVVTWATYAQYFQAGSNTCLMVLVAFVFVLAQISSSGADYFVSFWTREEESGEFTRALSTRDSLIVYGSVLLCCVTLTIVRSMTFFKMCMRASVGLHNTMFANIIHATMAFFNTNPSGRILNRFSKDMGTIDEMLPEVMVSSIQILLIMCGALTLVLISNYLLIVPMVIIGILFCVMRLLYISTARSLTRIQAITRSPVFNHLSATLDGLTTIRSSGGQEMVRREFDSHQNLHTSAWFTYVATERVFALYLDLLSALFTGIVTFSFLVLGTETFGSSVGMAVTQSTTLTGLLQFGIRSSAEVGRQMTSVERVLEYTHVKKETQFAGTKPPDDWPAKGRIVFKNVSLRYSALDPPVLKDLSFTIDSKQKVGIVGRTGAGKSSLIAALFRLTQPSGQILIDDVDVTEIGLNHLRRAISIIPQDPVLFSATVRDNLDPFNQFEDNQLWSALEEVELKQVVENLDFHVNEGGSNFSVGQRQLICLARAILRNNRILVLDEATANVDPQTDSLIQSTIRRRFSQCTVLTIAHRLNTVMDSDRILVMDAGTVAEFDHPHLLLQKGGDGRLLRMVQEAEPGMALQLIAVARQAYTSN